MSRTSRVQTHRVEEGLDAGQDGGARDPSGGDVQTASAIPQQSTPMHEPAEAALHDPPAREHDKACLSGVALDHTMADAVRVRPLVTGCSREGPVQDRLPQAGPRGFADIESSQRVAVLN